MHTILGLKFEGENEDDLKDKMDFQNSQKEHYPKSGKHIRISNSQSKQL